MEEEYIPRREHDECVRRLEEQDSRQDARLKALENTIEEIVNTPQETDDTPTAEERIAAALEYQVVASLPDDTESTDTASE